MQTIEMRVLLHRAMTWDDFPGDRERFEVTVESLQAEGLLESDGDVSPHAIDILNKLKTLKTGAKGHNGGLNLSELAILLHHSEEKAVFPISHRSHTAGMQMLKCIGYLADDNSVTPEGLAHVERLEGVEFFRHLNVAPGQAPRV